MKKFLLLCYTLSCSCFVHATDYTSPINGAKTFEDGDRVNVTGNSITAVNDSRVGSAGIHVNNNGAITVNAVGVKAQTTVGVSLSNQVANDLGTGSSIQATNNRSGFTMALDIYGKNSSLTATNLTTKAESTTNAVGINMRDGAAVELKGNNTINVVNGVGIRMNSNTADVTSFKTDKVNIESTGTTSIGIVTQGNNFIDLGDGSRIHTAASINNYTDRNIGIDASGGDVVAKNLTIIVDNTALGVTGTGTGISAKDTNVKVEGGTIDVYNGIGLNARQGSVISVKDVSISMSSENLSSRAIVAQNNGVVNVDKTTINMKNDIYGYGLVAGGPAGGSGSAKINAHDLTLNSSGITTGVLASAGGRVSLTGNTVINTDNTADDIAIGAGFMYGGGGIVDTGATGSKMILKGGITAIRKGLIDLNMLSGSTFTGASSIDDSSTIKLKMTDSVWNMTDNSQATGLTLTNSQINFIPSANNYHTLTVNNLSGNNANFAMHVDLGAITTAPNAANERIGTAGTNGDLLVVTNSIGAGNYHLNVVNNGAAQTQGNEVLQVVSTPNNNTGNFSLTAPVEAGAYEYRLRQSIDSTGNKTGWELYSNGLTPHRTTTAEAATSFLNSNYLLSYVDTQSLLQRMGELRKADPQNQQSGFWLRGFGGKLNSFAGQQLSGFDMTYSGTQLGIDKQLNSQLGQLYLGIMAGMTHANPNYRDGDGTTTDYHFGLYATLMMDNGIYVDGVAKYTYLKNHFSVKDTQDNSVQGKGTSDGYSLSLETGKRFHLSATSPSGFYIEPQGQITYGHQSGMSINASNGLKVQLGNYNYTLGRMSGIIGYEITGTNPINLYLKTGYVREMDSSTSYRLNNQKSNYNARCGWWDNGVGITAQFNKRHNIYADINYAKGSRFDQKQFNVGYRYSF